jgi:hypothetical protein
MSLSELLSECDRVAVRGGRGTFLLLLHHIAFTRPCEDQTEEIQFLWVVETRREIEIINKCMHVVCGV